MASSFGTKPIVITSSSTFASCSLDVLKAVYDHTNTTDVTWIGPSLSVISNVDTALPVDEGTYTVYVDLANGCQASKSTRYEPD